jgi:putative lipoic acid-binding regulatory protein
MNGDSPFEFPCDIPIKVFGRNDGDLRELALSIVRRHCAGVDEERVAEKRSRAGNYLSLTITVRAESRRQIDSVYRDLSASSIVLMVL